MYISPVGVIFKVITLHEKGQPLHFVLLLFCPCKSAIGQQVLHHEKEVIPQSLDFLDIPDIDTIHIYEGKDAIPYLGATATAHDSAVVVTMKKGAEILSLPQLLDSFDIEKDAIRLKVVTTYHCYKNGLPTPNLFFVSQKTVSSIGINSYDIGDVPHHEKFLTIDRFLISYRNKNSIIRNTIYSLMKQYNRIEKITEQ